MNRSNFAHLNHSRIERLPKKVARYCVEIKKQLQRPLQIIQTRGVILLSTLLTRGRKSTNPTLLLRLRTIPGSMKKRQIRYIEILGIIRTEIIQTSASRPHQKTLKCQTKSMNIYTRHLNIQGLYIEGCGLHPPKRNRSQRAEKST